MTTIAEIIISRFKDSDLNELPVGAVDLAIDLALQQYSVDFPCNKVVDVHATNDQLNMPPDWVNGISKLLDIDYPSDGSIPPIVEPPVVATDDGFSMSFSASQWVMYAGQYYLDVTHGLESNSVMTYIRDESNQVVWVNSVESLTLNTVRLWILNTATVFSGNIIVERA